MCSYSILNEALIIMNYKLNQDQQYQKKASMFTILKKFSPFLVDEKKNLIISFTALFVNSSLSLISPLIIGITIDKYIQNKQYTGVLINASLLLLIFIIGLVAQYIQTKTVGGIGQRLLFNLRNAVFTRLQSLPVAFFNQNKAGDLISRINSDTDNLNQFFSQALMQFIGNLVLMTGAAIFILSINFKLGFLALMPGLGIIIFTQLISPWVKRKNTTSLQSVGNLASEIQESLENFKVIVAFNRRDYFRQRFNSVNKNNFRNAVSAGIANNFFTPLYGFASNLAQIIVLFYGIYLISTGQFLVGLLISYLTYISRFYDPIRQIASLWSSFQLALASWDRITEILNLHSNLEIIPSQKVKTTDIILSFKDVSFHYSDSDNIINHINFDLKRGETYALVGPTGGGKTTIASLMARLYDATSGQVILDGQDIRSFSNSKRTQKIGFILQEPFLFSGTVKDNILYGNTEYINYSTEQLSHLLHLSKLDDLLVRFDQGLDTVIEGDNLSLGQRQLIAFIRVTLRRPELIILDEATANIDTLTEKLLDKILKKLPKSTTLVIIAHRLNTIASADEIFFVNSGDVTRAGSFDHAISLLMKDKRAS